MFGAMLGSRALGRSLGHAASKTTISRSCLPGLHPRGSYLSRSTIYPGAIYPGAIHPAHTCGNSKPPGTEKTESMLEFWGSRHLWKRAAINTFRCLIGCSLGDFSSMWFLQANHADIGMGMIMGISSKSSSNYCSRSNFLTLSGSGFWPHHIYAPRNRPPARGP